MWYIPYSQATLCKNSPDEEILQQISSGSPVKPNLIDLLPLYCQNQQISPQPERKKSSNKEFTFTLPSYKQMLSYHIYRNLMQSEILLILCNRPVTAFHKRKHQEYSTHCHICSEQDK